MKAARSNTAERGFTKKARKLCAAFDDKKTSKLPVRAAYIFLALPMYIFFFGWLKLYLALIFAGLLSFGMFYAWKEAPALDVSQLCFKDLHKAVLIAVLAMVWVYFSGIGQFAFQNYDHMWRNAILEKLVDMEWPVIVTDTKGYFGGPAAMIYYFAFWLPAACVGKMFSLGAAHVFLYWWSVIGVLITFTLVMCLRKKLSVWLIIGFTAFSGLDILGDFILHNSPEYTVLNSGHFEHWATGFQISSNTTQLFWVFNQAIPAWIITLLLLCQKTNSSVAFIYSFGMLSCTLPSIGLLPIIACIVIHRMVKMYDRKLGPKKNTTAILKECLSYQNVFAGIPTALISYAFLKTNTQADGGFRMIEIKTHLMPYIVSSLLEFLVFYFAVFRYQNKKPLYWTTLFSLLILPLFAVGTSIDFAMRSTIPAMLILFMMVSDTVIKSREQKDRGVFYALTALLVAGAVTPYHETARSVQNTINHINDPNTKITADEIDLFDDEKRGNFFGEYQDSIFFEYFAKD